MCKRSFNLPGKLGFPRFSHFFFDSPPFHSLVVKPRISTFTLHFSKTLVIISVVIAEVMIGFPLIEPELSSSKLTTVFFSLICFSYLKMSWYSGLAIKLANFDESKCPSSWS